jgi:hypothetical protein
MRVLPLLVATGLVTAGLITTAPAATAVGMCSLHVPSRFSIGAPSRAVTVTEGPNCAAAGVVDAVWLAHHPTTGVVNGAIFEGGARSEVVELVDAMPLGRWTWQPGGAYDAAGDTVAQYSPYTDVRVASYGRVAAKRAGAKVKLRTTAARYWQGGSRFIKWAGARGQLQYRTPGSTTWHGLKEVYSDPSGTYSYTYTTTAARDYRVVLRATGTIWESTSPAVHR